MEDDQDQVEERPKKRIVWVVAGVVLFVVLLVVVIVLVWYFLLRKPADETKTTDDSGNPQQTPPQPQQQDLQLGQTGGNEMSDATSLPLTVGSSTNRQKVLTITAEMAQKLGTGFLGAAQLGRPDSKETFWVKSGVFPPPGAPAGSAAVPQAVITRLDANGGWGFYMTIKSVPDAATIPPFVIGGLEKPGEKVVYVPPDYPLLRTGHITKVHNKTDYPDEFDIVLSSNNSGYIGTVRRTDAAGQSWGQNLTVFSLPNPK